MRQQLVIHQTKKFHSVFSKREIVEEFGSCNFFTDEGQQVIKKCGIRSEYLARWMPVYIKTKIMNRKQTEQQIVGTEMNIPASCLRDRVKLIAKNSIGGEPGKKNLFICFRN